MGIDFLKLLSGLPMSVIRRALNKAALVGLDSEDKESYKICLDEEDEYSFSNEVFCFTKPNHRVFYDGSEKILEYFFDGQNITIQIFTIKQSNLFVDIAVERCSIHALGPLYVQGKFRVADQHSIHAKALTLDGYVVSDDALQLSATDDLIVFGEVSTQKLSVHARVYNQSAIITAHQFFDLSAQVFFQMQEARLNTPVLRLISEFSWIAGHFEVSNNCFLAVSHLLLGETGCQSEIHFPTLHHVHAGTLTIQGSAQVTIGEEGSFDLDAQWLIDEDILMGELSALRCHHINLQCRKMVCAGSMQAYDSLIEIETLITKSGFRLSRSRLGAKSIHIESGLFLAADTRIDAKKIHALSGELLIQTNSGVMLESGVWEK